MSPSAVSGLKGATAKWRGDGDAPKGVRYDVNACERAFSTLDTLRTPMHGAAAHHPIQHHLTLAQAPPRGGRWPRPTPRTVGVSGMPRGGSVSPPLARPREGACRPSQRPPKQPPASRPMTSNDAVDLDEVIPYACGEDPNA